MVNVHPLRLICRLLSCFAASAATQNVSGVDSAENYPDYGYYPGPPSSNETVTHDQVDGIINEAVREARHQVLKGPELLSLMNAKIKDHFNARKQCMKDGSSYFDYMVGDCRSCLREHCDKDDICKTECRDFLKMIKITDDFTKFKEEIQRLNGSLHVVQNRQQSFGCKTWLVVLTTLAAAALFLIVVLIVAIIIAKLILSSKEQQPITAKPADDEATERKCLTHTT